MKTAPALVLLCLAATCLAQNDEGKVAMDKCLEKTGLTVDDLKADHDGKKHETKCFYSCMVQNFGMLDEQGKFSVQDIELVAAKATDEAERKELIDKTLKCKETVEASGATDICEIGAAFFACSTKAFMSVGGAKS